LTLTWPEANEEIQSALDDTSKAVSGDAFERHGEITRLDRGELQFLGALSCRSSKQKAETVAPSECPRCNHNVHRSFVESVRNDPFCEDETYEVFINGSHEEIPCNGCRQSGRIQCKQCNGNGRTKCRQCRGDGFEERERSCETCERESVSTEECTECDGRGTIRVEEQCSSCKGTGFTKCNTCRGRGVVECDHCEGVGFQHQYELKQKKARSTIEAEGIPDDWETNPQAVGGAIDWPTGQPHIDELSKNKVALQTNQLEAHYITVKYGDNEHKATIPRIGLGQRVIWDSDAGLPNTWFC